MKRLYLVAVAGLCSLAPARAQEGPLAPTAPVVPAPVVQQNGNPLSPAGGSGSRSAASRAFALTKWSPFRNPATAGDPPVAPVVGPPAYHGAPLPPPAGVGAIDGSCGPGGSCAPGGHGRRHSGSCWERFKKWLCYHPTDTDLPRCHPMPYNTPLQGMFACSDWGGGCGSCVGGNGHPWGPPPPPLPPAPVPPSVPPMQAPPQVGAGYRGTGAVTMPGRGAQGTAIAPTWQGRATPVPATPGPAGYTFTVPDVPALSGNVVNTGAKVPQK